MIRDQDIRPPIQRLKSSTIILEYVNGLLYLGNDKVVDAVRTYGDEINEARSAGNTLCNPELDALKNTSTVGCCHDVMLLELQRPSKGCKQRRFIS